MPAGQTEAFVVYRYHAVFTDSTEPMLAAEATHRDHAIIEQIIAELKNGPDRRPPWNSRTDRQLNNAHPTIKPTEDQLPTQQTRDGGSRLSHAVMTSRVLAELIAARYPDRTVHVVGDAAYVGERLRDVDGRITWTSRLKATSVLHELPPPRTGRSGRPRTRDARLGTPRRCRRPRDDHEHMAHH